MRWGGGRGETSSIRVLLLQSSPPVALRAFSRGHLLLLWLYSWETEARSSKVTDLWSVQSPEKDLALLGSSQVLTTS